MARLWPGKRFGPIGVDLGTHSVKLLQMDAERGRVLAHARLDLPTAEGQDDRQRDAVWTDGLRQARQGHGFQGRDAVLCLTARDLFVQNIRVPKGPSEALEKTVLQEAAGRLPFPLAEAEVRFLEAADVRQGEAVKREVILLACHRPVLQRLLGLADAAGLRPVGIDVEPAALVRCYFKQFRREDDKQQRMIFVHVGATNTAVVITNGDEALFVKYIDLGGRRLDEAVARHLKMSLPEATTLRRHNGDRRVDQQDPEVARSVAEAVRPVLERLAGEVALCLRYHSVTFRGQPLSRLVLGGGEANASLVEFLGQRIDLKCELGEPLRSLEPAFAGLRSSQWDVAAGLAMWETN